MELDSDSHSPCSRLNQSNALSIQGMDSVVATVSGYHGSERFKLIKLISLAGASYVGAMSRSTTHLVCWKFEGKKYNLAKKFKMVIINHRWIEDCIKQKKRVPERPYMLQSGQDIGPLLLELPLVTKKHFVFSGQSYHRLGDDSENEDNDMDYKGSELAAWTDSFLLKENLLPNFGKSNGTYRKPKPKPFKRTSKLEQLSSVRYCFQEPPLSRLVSMENEESNSDSSIHSMRGKRKISKHDKSSTHSNMWSAREKGKVSKDTRTTLNKPPGKGRRLVKKSICGDVTGSMLSDSDLEGHPISRTGEASNDGFLKYGEINEGFEEIEHTDYPRPLERVSQDGCSDIDNLNERVKDPVQIEHVNRLPTSLELSCVICWTEFSPTRGVLPCGHRFCYSCIQNWADHMASMRKISTCPLCKASFMSITKVEEAATSDQKIYSQTIPCPLSRKDIFILTDQDTLSICAQSSLLPACSQCRSREPEELLVRCHLCQTRCIHSYCLDPPLLPWTCIHCKDLQMLYHHSY